MARSRMFVLVPALLLSFLVLSIGCCAEDDDEDRSDFEIVSFEPAESVDGAAVGMTAVVKNSKSKDVTLEISLESDLPGSMTVDPEITVPGKSTQNVTIEVVPADEAEGVYDITMSLTMGNDNANTATATIMVTRPTVEPPAEERGSTSPPFQVTQAVGITVCSAVFLGALAAIIGTDLGRWSLSSLLVVIPLYTRLKKDHLKDHVHRAKLLKFIEASPGAHFSEIRRNLDLHNGVLAYHLKALEREKLVSSKRDGQYKRFYPRSMQVPTKMIEDLTWHQLAILDVVRKTPGIRQKEIAVEMGQSKQVINYHLRTLLELGVVVKEVEGRESYYTADEKRIYEIAK